jgi:hypothetical protein
MQVAAITALLTLSLRTASELSEAKALSRVQSGFPS